MGDVLLFQANSWAYLKKGPDCSFLRVTYELDRLVVGLRLADQREGLKLSVLQIHRSRLVEELLALLDLGSREFVKKHALSLLLAETSRLLSETKVSDAASPRERFALIEQFVRDNLDRAITRQVCSEAFGLSLTHISRMFNAYAGRSFQQYVETLRLGRACELLLDTQMKVVDVAAACGFSSDAYFVRKFREAFDSTPAVWRVQAGSVEPSLATNDEGDSP